MNRSRIVIVGLGAIGRQLLASLHREFEVVVVDRSVPEAGEEALDGAARRVAGDATSRLVLEDAGVAEADAVVITTASERVNREVARVVREGFSVPRVLAVAITPEGAAELEALGVEVVDLFRQSSRALRNRLERRAQAAHGIGQERGEILEVEVHPNSRLLGKTLGELAPARWRVGLIYRDGEILLPGGAVSLRARDRVVLTGEPSVLRTVGEMLTFRFQAFPLEYGATLAVCLCGGEGEVLRREVGYLAATLPLSGVQVLAAPAAAETAGAYRDLPGAAAGARPVPAGRWEGAIRELAADRDTRPGLVVFARDVLERRGGVSQGLLHTLSQEVGCPLLLAGGSFPYRQLAVPCIGALDLQHVLESVFEMESYLGHRPVRGLVVKPSPYLSAEGRGLEEARALLHEMSLVYRSPAAVVELAGNPVRAVLGALDGVDLLVADTGGWSVGRWYRRWLDTEPVWPVVQGAAASTLLLPPEEESL